ncbi:MAG: TIM barrel protein [Clostridia bacterium]
MKKYQVGFTSTTFRKERRISKIVEIAVAADAKYIEWGGDIHVKTVEEAMKAKKLSDEKGLIISSYASYYVIGSGDKEQWERICKICQALGAKSVRVWLGKLGTGSDKFTDEMYAKLVEDGKAICDVAKQYDLIVSPECHRNTYNDTTDTFLKAAKDIDRDNFKTYFQSVYLDLEYDFDRLERTIDYIENIHISYSEQSREQLFKKHDKAFIDKLMAKVIELDFDGIVLLEYTYLVASTKFMTKDIARLKNY